MLGLTVIHDLIKLDRPLISVDLETTGLYPAVDRIVQIGVIKVYPDGRVTEWESLIDPGIPISQQVSEIHHITNATVKDAPLFEHIAEKLFIGFRECDFTGYNAKAFDIKFLIEEFKRCRMTFVPGRIVDTFTIFKKYNPRNLTAAVSFYLREDHVDAHSAMADARAALRVLRAQLLLHKELPRTIEELDAIAKTNPNFVDTEGKFIWKDGEVYINFGGRNGVALKKCDRNYLEWMSRKEFTAEVKSIVINALNGKYPTRS